MSIRKRMNMGMFYMTLDVHKPRCVLIEPMAIMPLVTTAVIVTCATLPDAENRVCLFYEEREFGDSVYTYKCAVLSQCERYKLDNLAIVGRSLSAEQRSVTEIICDRCCNGDLCNKHCSYKDCKGTGSFTNVSGVYSVRPEGTNEDIEVYCDITTDGGG
ncbi:uncharacterized protein LOC127847099 [Dreissena polymorpha]|uniref:uncharacterized protein LOC127847099 n=1 Tax=Dreissena polymorpha TaxID=45954 RepID=UPI002263DFA4|nr:uncharacterized protein LOC127847099 [Dreissena polymorpha]